VVLAWVPAAFPGRDGCPIAKEEKRCPVVVGARYRPTDNACLLDGNTLLRIGKTDDPQDAAT
jgi:hypothetical protein